MSIFIVILTIALPLYKPRRNLMSLYVTNAVVYCDFFVLVIVAFDRYGATDSLCDARAVC